MDNQHYEFALIGGGTAAITAVIHALSLGATSVALIESRKELGGECALNACVPTKTLLTAAKTLNMIREKASKYGIQVPGYQFDFSRLMTKVDAVIEDGEYAFLDDPRVTRYQGHACFENPVTLSLPETQQRVRAEKFIVATGAEPRALTVPGAAEIGYITFQEATHLKQLPQSLIIIGAGPVGVEFAYIYASLGVQVTLLQKNPAVLPREEPEIQQAVQAMLEKLGVQVITQVTLQQLEPGLEAAKRLRFKTPETGPMRVEAEEILSAIGMTPRVGNLGLEAANITYTPQKGIEVSPEMQTTNPFVWAIGDVVQQYAFTHVADYQAEVAVENALLGSRRQVDYTGLGWAIYTEPCVAHVGMTEAQAREVFPEIDTTVCSTNEVSRYRIESETDGFLKLIIKPGTHQLLGAHIFASAADEMAHVLMLAIRQGMSCEALLNSMLYIYPARTQLIQKALENYLSQFPATFRSPEFLVTTPIAPEEQSHDPYA